MRPHVSTVASRSPVCLFGERVKTWESVCSVRTVWIKNIIGLTDAGLCLLSVRARVWRMWGCGGVSAAVCLGRLAGSGVSEPRAEVPPQLTDVFKPNRPLKTRRVTSDTPLSASPWQAPGVRRLSCSAEEKKVSLSQAFPSNCVFVVGSN